MIINLTVSTIMMDVSDCAENVSLLTYFKFSMGVLQPLGPII